MEIFFLNIVFVIALSTVTYLYWRNLRSYLNSPYRAFDLLLITLLFFVLVSRLIGILTGLGTDYQVIQLEQLVTFFGVRFEYLSFLFVPILAFQFLNQSIEIREDWKEYLFWPVIFSNIGLAVLLVFDLVQLLILEPEMAQARAFQLVSLTVLAIAGAVAHIYFKRISKFSTQNVLMTLVIQQFILQVVIWIFAYISPVETLRQSLALLVLFIIVIIPIISGEFKFKDKGGSSTEQIRNRIIRGV